MVRLITILVNITVENIYNKNTICKSFECLFATKLFKMLEYVKIILQKVSFDIMLFQKELQKSIAWLTEEEKGELKIWLNSSFTGEYKNVIKEILERKVA